LSVNVDQLIVESSSIDCPLLEKPLYSVQCLPRLPPIKDDYLMTMSEGKCTSLPAPNAFKMYHPSIYVTILYPKREHE